MHLPSPFCMIHQVFLNRTCIQFEWFERNNQKELFSAVRCEQNAQQFKLSKNKDLFIHLLKATSITSLTFLFGFRFAELHTVSYTRKLHLFRTTMKTIALDKAKGFYHCESQSKSVFIGLNIYQLKEISYISSYFVFKDILTQCHEALKKKTFGY